MTAVLEVPVSLEGPSIVGLPCPHYGSASLIWPAHPELEAFMRATYEAHVVNACAAGRVFRAKVPNAELTVLAKGQYLRTEVVPLAVRMLRDASAALSKAKVAGDPGARTTGSFAVTSAYRSAARQFGLWQARFPGYFDATTAQRAALAGGPTGPGAVQFMARWIGRWLAAPGFSNHNDGRAIDMTCVVGGATLSARRGDIAAWKRSWLHGWLVAHASCYGFAPYAQEPWHWEHRPGAAPGSLGSAPAREGEGFAAPSHSARVPTSDPATGVVAYWSKQLRFGLAGNTVKPLIDGPAAFREIRSAIDTADDRRHFIYLLGWWVDPWVNLDGHGTSLLDLLSAAGQRGVQVRVLMWDAPLSIYPGHSKLHDAAVKALNRLPNCHAQQDAGGWVGSPKSHHQKLLVVEGSAGLIALAGGVDVNADRINQLPPPASTFRPDRPDVGWTGASGSSGGGGGSGNPLHDVHVRVAGPTALPLLRAFLRRWWARSGSRDIDVRDPLRGRYDHPVPAPAGRHHVRIGETFDGVLQLPEGRVSSRQVTVQDIWLRSILGARRFIYMEEQYLTSACAAKAIRSVLPRLSHVTILIPPSEITDLPGVWRRRKAFIDAITRGNPHAGKLRVYTRATTPGSCVRDNGPHLYVHAKMAVIDDEVMLIGSANCNNRGWETDSELVVAAFEEPDAGGWTTASGLRAALWSHHLGQPVASLRDPVVSRGLWDTARTRQVCLYDPVARKDQFGSDRPDRLTDPPGRRPGDPCLTLLPR